MASEGPRGRGARRGGRGVSGRGMGGFRHPNDSVQSTIVQLIGTFSTLPTAARSYVYSQLTAIMGLQTGQPPSVLPAPQGATPGAVAPGAGQPQARQRAWDRPILSGLQCANTLRGLSRPERTSQQGREAQSLLSAAIAAVARARRDGLEDREIGPSLHEAERDGIEAIRSLWANPGEDLQEGHIGDEDDSDVEHHAEESAEMSVDEGAKAPKKKRKSRSSKKRKASGAEDPQEKPGGGPGSGGPGSSVAKVTETS